MNAKISFLVASTAIVLLTAVHAEPPKTTSPVRNQAGYRIYINPMTGQPIPKPKTEDSESRPLSARERNAMSTSSQGLVEKYHLDGSVSVNLQGRFQSTVFATVDKEGKVKTSHHPTKEED